MLLLQMQTKETKSTEKLHVHCHMCHKQQAVFAALLCITFSPSRTITLRDFGICSLKSILQP
jgi:hypothetical protein